MCYFVQRFYVLAFSLIAFAAFHDAASEKIPYYMGSTVVMVDPETLFINRPVYALLKKELSTRRDPPLQKYLVPGREIAKSSGRDQQTQKGEFASEFAVEKDSLLQIRVIPNQKEDFSRDSDPFVGNGQRYPSPKSSDPHSKSVEEDWHKSLRSGLTNAHLHGKKVHSDIYRILKSDGNPDVTIPQSKDKFEHSTLDLAEETAKHSSGEPLQPAPVPDVNVALTENEKHIDGEYIKSPEENLGSDLEEVEGNIATDIPFPPFPDGDIQEAEDDTIDSANSPLKKIPFAHEGAVDAFLDVKGPAPEAERGSFISHLGSANRGHDKTNEDNSLILDSGLNEYIRAQNKKVHSRLSDIPVNKGHVKHNNENVQEIRIDGHPIVFTLEEEERAEEKKVSQGKTLESSHRSSSGVDPFNEFVKRLRGDLSITHEFPDTLAVGLEEKIIPVINDDFSFKTKEKKSSIGMKKQNGLVYKLNQGINGNKEELSSSAIPVDPEEDLWLIKGTIENEVSEGGALVTENSFVTEESFLNEDKEATTEFPSELNDIEPISDDKAIKDYADKRINDKLIDGNVSYQDIIQNITEIISYHNVDENMTNSINADRYIDQNEIKIIEDILNNLRISNPSGIISKDSEKTNINTENLEKPPTETTKGDQEAFLTHNKLLNGILIDRLSEKLNDAKSRARFNEEPNEFEKSAGYSITVEQKNPNNKVHRITIKENDDKTSYTYFTYSKEEAGVARTSNGNISENKLTITNIDTLSFGNEKSSSTQDNDEVYLPRKGTGPSKGNKDIPKPNKNGQGIPDKTNKDVPKPNQSFQAGKLSDNDTHDVANPINATLSEIVIGQISGIQKPNKGTKDVPKEVLNNQALPVKSTTNIEIIINEGGKLRDRNEKDDKISPYDSDDYDDEALNEEEEMTDERIAFIDYEATDQIDVPKCRCGVPESNRIIGGQAIRVEKNPWMVQQVFKDGDLMYCAGTIINDRYILTAAHCLTDTLPEDIYIRVGHTSSGDPGIVVQVESFILHRRYKDSDIAKYDIALIKLAAPLQFTERILPICLPKRKFFNGEEGFISGWGTMSELGDTSDSLQSAGVSIMEFDVCRNESSYDDIDLNGLVLCAREKNVDSCQGDSGGPLVHFDGEAFSQIGITSWGIGCARKKYPGIYTKVSRYHKWIRERTKDAHFCRSPIKPNSNEATSSSRPEVASEVPEQPDLVNTATEKPSLPNQETNNETIYKYVKQIAMEYIG